MSRIRVRRCRNGLWQMACPTCQVPSWLGLIPAARRYRYTTQSAAIRGANLHVLKHEIRDRVGEWLPEDRMLGAVSFSIFVATRQMIGAIDAETAGRWLRAARGCRR